MKKAISVITVIFFLVTSFASCAAGAANGKTMEDWPNDVPSSLPAFTYGVYQSGQTTRNDSGGVVTYQMRFTGVSREDVEAYAEELRKTSLTVIPIEGEGVYIVNTEKVIGDLCIVPVYAYLEEPTGTCSLTVTVNFKYTDYLSISGESRDRISGGNIS